MASFGEDYAPSPAGREQSQMKRVRNLADTIAAIATGGAVSAIGIVRLSGENAIEIADKIFRSAGGTKLSDAENRRMRYGRLIGADGRLIDLCMCTVSRGPNSYTGEDTAEFHCHGSPVVLAQALLSIFAHGARQALPGEFTKRAFLNGRMDLAQAEAVIDLIEAETPAAAQNAAGQLYGAISAKLEDIYSALLDIMAHFHAVIDYPDEDIDEFSAQSYLSALKGAEAVLSRLLSTHSRGRVLREGLPTAIVGRPNTGKSSLLNALLGYERAIVTEIPGTTRDTIEEKITVGGVLLRLIDTAGLREAAEAVEKLGVMRTLEAVSRAGLALLVLDGSEPLREEDSDALRSIPGDVPIIAAVNKSDLPHVLADDELAKLGVDFCRVCALTGDGFGALEEKIKRAFPLQPQSAPGEIITNARQAEAISRAREGVMRAIEAAEASFTPDAVLADVEAALAAIGEITGKTMREDIISRIFERFCVGK